MPPRYQNDDYNDSDHYYDYIYRRKMTRQELDDELNNFY